MTGGIVTRAAHAKVNAFLRVLGRREDGYHELESLVIPLDLTDSLTIRPARELRVDVRGATELVDAVNAGGMNLALVAALALAEECDPVAGAVIEISKRIPVAAGLGGGSADAAAALHALNEFWGCGIEAGALTAIAERVGSDVPSLLAGGPVVMRGRGEWVHDALVPTTSWAVKSLDFPTRSPDAYRWWDEDGAVTGPDPAALYASAESGSLATLGPALFNDLEGPVSRRHPEVADTKAAFLEAGALGALMSGSGPAVAALARTPQDAERLAAAVPGAFVAAGLARMG